MIDHQRSIAITRPVLTLTANHDSTLTCHRKNPKDEDDNVKKKETGDRTRAESMVYVQTRTLQNASRHKRRPRSPIRSAREIYARGILIRSGIFRSYSCPYHVRHCPCPTPGNASSSSSPALPSFPYPVCTSPRAETALFVRVRATGCPPAVHPGTQPTDAN